NSLSHFDVLGSRTLWTLSSLEGDRLAFLQIIKARVVAGRRVKEVFVPVARQNEPKPFPTDESFDRAVHRCHRRLLSTFCGALLGLGLGKAFARGGVCVRALVAGRRGLLSTLKHLEPQPA